MSCNLSASLAEAAEAAKAVGPPFPRFDEKSPRVFTMDMYRRPKFLEILLEIRQQMAHEADYDVDLFAEMVRSGSKVPGTRKRTARYADPEDKTDDAVIPQLTRSRDA